MSWPAVKKNYTQEQFRQHVASLTWPRWRPSLIVLHNTAAPTLAQWHDTEAKDVAAHLTPGITRIGNLERYFEFDQHWSGAPHLFIPDDFIWEFNPLNEPGVHSPSWNHVAIGIEMVADFDVEDDDSGPGLVVRRNAVFATALLCATLGLDPRKAVKLHKEDPKTTHACPGMDFAQDRDQVIDEIEALMPGGEHSPHDVAIAIGAMPAPTAPAEKKGTVTVADLNVRRGPGVTSESIGSLPKGLSVAVLGEASNGTTGWSKIRTPFGSVGWVASRFVSVA
jgi:hypothetical protein